MRDRPGPLRPPAPADDDDRVLLAAVAAGDRSAFEVFHHRYAPVVQRFVRNLVRDDGDAEELTIDVMVTVWRTAGRYAGRSRVRSWLLGIAHHKAIDVLRRRRIAYAPLDEVRGIADDADGPDVLAIADAERETLRRALAELSPAHRAVLELAYLHDLSLREIAEIVDAPLATVKTRAFYAKRHLRTALEAS